MFKAPHRLIELGCLANYSYYTLNSLSPFWLAKSIPWILEISDWLHLPANNTIIMSRTLKVTGNHSCHVWLRCKISKGNHAKFVCVNYVACHQSEEAKTQLPFLFRSLYNKMVWVFSLSLRPQLITSTVKLIILDMIKTSFYNCLLWWLLWLLQLLWLLWLLLILLHHGIFNLPVSSTTSLACWTVSDWRCPNWWRSQWKTSKSVIYW